jgi:hypothetical protein
MRMVLQGLDPDDPGLTWDRSPRQQWVMPGIEEQRAPT